MTENNTTADTSVPKEAGDKATGSPAQQAAVEARRAAYDAVVRRALPIIRKAEQGSRIYKAKTLACFLNLLDVPSPSGSEWCPRSVLRALHRLKELGLHEGPAPAHRLRWHSRDPWLKSGGCMPAREDKKVAYSKFTGYL